MIFRRYSTVAYGWMLPKENPDVNSIKRDAGENSKDERNDRRYHGKAEKDERNEDEPAVWVVLRKESLYLPRTVREYCCKDLRSVKGRDRHQIENTEEHVDRNDDTGKRIEARENPSIVWSGDPEEDAENERQSEIGKGAGSRDLGGSFFGVL